MVRPLQWSLALVLCCGTAANAQSARVLVQSSPLAGFEYYEAGAVWSELKPGDRLQLEREPDNVHDAHAIRVTWRGRMLGYVPRRENAHLARQLEHGVRLEARIVNLTEHRNRRRRLEFEVYVDL
jgi:hypothetical protein